MVLDDSYWEELRHLIQANACLRVDRELSKKISIEMGVKLRCVMSLWLLNIFMNWCMKEIKAILGNFVAR